MHMASKKKGRNVFMVKKVIYEAKSEEREMYEKIGKDEPT